MIRVYLLFLSQAHILSPRYICLNDTYMFIHCFISQYCILLVLVETLQIYRWQTQGPMAEFCPLPYFIRPAPCFYPAAALSSLPLVKEQSHVYSPKITFGPLKATARLMWHPGENYFDNSVVDCNALSILVNESIKEQKYAIFLEKRGIQICVVEKCYKQSNLKNGKRT